MATTVDKASAAFTTALFYMANTCRYTDQGYRGRSKSNQVRACSAVTYTTGVDGQDPEK